MWTLKDDQLHCARHDQTFDKGKVCSGCIDDPGPEPDDEEPVALDPEAIRDEQWCRDRRDAMIAIAEGMTMSASDRKSKARIEYSTVAKIYDTALKYHRAACEERRLRAETAHDRWLVKQYRELAMRGASH